MAINIDFTQARFKHLNWKFRIRNFLDGKETLTIEQAISHTECDLGKWYYSVGKAKYGHLKEMQDFEKEHEDLHTAIKEIVQLKKQGLLMEAETKYKTVLKLSENIILFLDETEKKMK